MALKEDEIAKIVNKAMKDLDAALKEVDKSCKQIGRMKVYTISSSGQYDLYDLQEDEERLKEIFSKDADGGKTPEYYANRSYGIRVFYNVFFELINEHCLSIIDLARLITTAYFLCVKTAQAPRSLCDLREFSDKSKIEDLILNDESRAIEEFFKQCCYKISVDAEEQNFLKGTMLNDFRTYRFFWRNMSICKLPKEFGNQRTRFGTYLKIGSLDEVAWVCVSEAVRRYNFYKKILNNVLVPIYDVIPISSPVK